MSIFWHSLCGRGKGRLSSGFGLVELLVSISIMILVTTVLLVNHGGFSNNSLLRTQAFDVALTFREIQQAAVNAQAHNGFLNSFGLRWDPSPPTDPTSILGRSLQPIVMPHTTNATFDPTAASNFGAPRILDDDFAILCVHDSAIVTPIPEDDCRTTPVVILFKRPNFDAIFYDPSGSLPINPLTITGLRFVIGPRGTPFVAADVGSKTRAVTITSNGQVTVE